MKKMMQLRASVASGALRWIKGPAAIVVAVRLPQRTRGFVRRRL